MFTIWKQLKPVILSYGISNYCGIQERSFIEKYLFTKPEILVYWNQNCDNENLIANDDV